MFLVHSFDSFKVVKQLSTRTVIQNKANEVVSLETVVKLDDEWVVEHGVDLLLVLYDVFLLIL